MKNYILTLLTFIAFTITSVPIHAQAASSTIDEATAQELNTKSLEESLEFVVAKAIEIAETTGEFVVEQAPLLLQEFYAWRMVKNILNMLLFPLLIILVFIYYKAIPIEEDSYEAVSFLGKQVNQGHGIPGYIVGIAAGFFAVGIFICSLYDLLFLLVAPKMYLIEYFLK